MKKYKKSLTGYTSRGLLMYFYYSKESREYPTVKGMKLDIPPITKSKDWHNVIKVKITIEEV